MANKISREDVFYSVNILNQTTQVHLNIFSEFANANNVHSVIVHDIKEKDELMGNIEAEPQIKTYGVITCLISDPHEKYEVGGENNPPDSRIWIELDTDIITDLSVRN